MKIAPSLLAADFTRLHEEIEKIKNADMLHLDIMDGHFVPNISFGAEVVRQIRKICDLEFDVHLMLSRPMNYIERFANAGADIIAVHIECKDNILEVIEKIKSFSVKPALVIKPDTPVESVFPYLDKIHMVLVMTVEPGFGGQSMMVEHVEKVRIIKEKSPNTLVELDGGIGRENIHLCTLADICVCGTSVFSAENPSLEIEYLKTGGKA